MIHVHLEKKPSMYRRWRKEVEVPIFMVGFDISSGIQKWHSNKKELSPLSLVHSLSPSSSDTSDTVFYITTYNTYG